MVQKRGIITDQLLHIIEVIELGRKTGVLTIDRGDGGRQEHGEMRFMRGQITEASCGGLSGKPAADVLKMWRQCRFLFEETDEETGPLPGPIITGTEERRETSLRITSPLPSSTGALEKLQLSDRTTGRLPRLYTDESSPRRTLGDEESLRRLRDTGLSRLHLRLFLLIDGRRAFAEFVRLIGRQPSEVQMLLHDLERIGVIQR